MKKPPIQAPPAAPDPQIHDDAKENLELQLAIVHESAEYKARLVDDNLLAVRFRSLFPQPENSDETIRDFVDCIRVGELPHPAVLVSIATGLHRYLVAEG